MLRCDWQSTLVQRWQMTCTNCHEYSWQCLSLICSSPAQIAHSRSYLHLGIKCYKLSSNHLVFGARIPWQQRSPLNHEFRKIHVSVPNLLRHKMDFSVTPKNDVLIGTHHQNCIHWCYRPQSIWALVDPHTMSDSTSCLIFASSACAASHFLSIDHFCICPLTMARLWGGSTRRIVWLSHTRLPFHLCWLQVHSMRNSIRNCVSKTDKEMALALKAEVSRCYSHAAIPEYAQLGQPKESSWIFLCWNEKTWTWPC